VRMGGGRIKVDQAQRVCSERATIGCCSGGPTKVSAGRDRSSLSSFNLGFSQQQRQQQQPSLSLSPLGPQNNKVAREEAEICFKFWLADEK